MATRRKTTTTTGDDQDTPETDLDEMEDVLEEEDQNEDAELVKEEVKEAPRARRVNKRTNKPILPKMKTEPDKSPRDPFWLEPGDSISLNMKQRAMIMFPLPGGRIFRMNNRLWNAEIPKDTPPEWVKALMLLFEQGDIVKGKQFCPKYPKNAEVMKKFQKYLDLPIAQLIKKLKPLVLHRGLIEGYRSSEILMAMMRFEQDHFHRKQYIDLVNEALEHIGGAGPITQSPVQNLTAEGAEELAEDLA